MDEDLFQSSSCEEDCLIHLNAIEKVRHKEKTFREKSVTL